jgi:hypothetical protein
MDTSTETNQIEAAVHVGYVTKEELVVTYRAMGICTKLVEGDQGPRFLEDVTVRDLDLQYNVIDVVDGATTKISNR